MVVLPFTLSDTSDPVPSPAHGFATLVIDQTPRTLDRFDRRAAL
jgi:hypothetical protein